ncbi:MAG: hypothetical protein ACSHYF_05260 [Verrucomicrobiaceae bacterium]
MKYFLTILTVILIAFIGYRFGQPGGFWGYKYKSTAVIQVHPSMISANGPGRGYMESEFETPASEENLRYVIEDISLDQGWNLSPEETLAQLKLQVIAKPRRGTDFIEIIAKSHDEQEAKLLADAVAEAFISRKNSIEQDRAEMALEALDEELSKQEELVESAKKELLSLLGDHGDLRQPAETGYENARGLLKEMKVAQQEQRVLLKMPRTVITRHE